MCVTSWCGASSKPTKETIIQVDVQIACQDAWSPTSEDVSAWLSSAVVAAGREGAAEVSVRIVCVDEIQALNRDFRGQDKATNVLSFPAGTVVGLPVGETCTLGDIVICASVVAAEARAQGKSEVDHWMHMVVHGTLHLLGYDHEADDAAAAMEALEVRVLTSLGVGSPYEESPQQT